MTALRNCKTIYVTETLSNPLDPEFINMLSSKIIFTKTQKSYHCIASEYNIKELRVPASLQVPGFITICKNYGGVNDIDTAISNVEQYFIDREIYIQSIISSSKNIAVAVQNIDFDGMQPRTVIDNLPLMSELRRFTVSPYLSHDFINRDTGFTVSHEDFINRNTEFAVSHEDIVDEDLDRYGNIEEDETDFRFNITPQNEYRIDRDNIYTGYAPDPNDTNIDLTFNQKNIKLERYHPSITKDFLNLMSLAKDSLRSQKQKILEHGLYFRKYKNIDDNFYDTHKPDEGEFDIVETKNYCSYAGFLGPKYIDSMFYKQDTMFPGLTKTYGGLDSSVSCDSYGEFSAVSDKKIKTRNNYLTDIEEQTEYNSTPKVNEYMDIMETLRKEFNSAPIVLPDILKPIIMKNLCNEKIDELAREHAIIVRKRKVLDDMIKTPTKCCAFMDFDDY